MAGDWIKWTKGLTRKPEVIQVAHRLTLSRHAAAGLLMEVWEWADDNVMIDENVSGFDPDNCPGTVRLGEQPKQLFDATFDVPGLADALTAVGWIEIRSGSLTFPNFARHNGKSAKARALDSARKRTVRAAVPPSVPKVSGSQPDKSRIRGEERREEENLKPPDPPKPGGKGRKKSRSIEELETDPQFVRFWDAYPKKVAKIDAAKAFAKIDPNQELLGRILAGLDVWKRSAQWVKDDGQYINHAATWLNGKMWNEEPPPNGKPSKPLFETQDERVMNDLIDVSGGAP